MKEPQRMPLDPSTPTTKKVKQIPMPKLYPETMSDEVYTKSIEQEIWDIIQKQKNDRKINQQSNET